MNIGLHIILSGLVAALGLGLAVFTAVQSRRIEAAHPPSGQFADIAGTRMHYVDLPARDPEAPTVVLIHGASGNLEDQLAAARPRLEGKVRLIAVDRPGHGWSSRGPADNDTPDGQARTIAALLDHLGAKPAIVVGHSFGGAITAALALERPDVVAGLLFLAPATHPWPGGATNWYNDLAATPVIGWLFAHTLALPGGLSRLGPATDCVFSPNKAPDDYLASTGIALVLTPQRFLANSRDVSGLYRNVVRLAPRYPTITALTIIITGDRDTVVYEEIHSDGLERDIAGARKLVVHNVGHKPDYVIGDLVEAAIAVLSGEVRDLDAMVEEAERRHAGDAFGPVERCPQPTMPKG